MHARLDWHANVRVYLSDRAHNYSESNIVVQPADAPPVLNPVAARTLSEGDSLRFRLVAPDVDRDTLAYSSLVLPGGASHTGEFEWTPGYAQADA